MKQVVRILILMLGIVGTCFAATVPQVPASDGGAIPTHPLSQH
jgi:hypothetical protein